MHPAAQLRVRCMFSRTACENSSGVVRCCPGRHLPLCIDTSPVLRVPRKDFNLQPRLSSHWHAPSRGSKTPLLRAESSRTLGGGSHAPVPNRGSRGHLETIGQRFDGRMPVHCVSVCVSVCVCACMLVCVGVCVCVRGEVRKGGGGGGGGEEKRERMCVPFP